MVPLARTDQEPAAYSSVLGIIFTVGFSIGLVTNVMAVGPYLENEAPSPDSEKVTRLVKGRLLKIDGYIYLIRDDTGEDVELTVGPDTHMQRL